MLWVADTPCLSMFATRPVCGGVESDQHGQTYHPGPNLCDAVDRSIHEQHSQQSSVQMHSKLKCRLPSQGPRDAQQDQSLSQALQRKRYSMMLWRKSLVLLTPTSMFLRGHDVVGKRAAQRSTSSHDLLCSGVEVADCIVFCIASAALSSLLTCSVLRYQRRKCRSRNPGQVKSARKPDACSTAAVIRICFQGYQH